jgi:FAD/FMN-containing dehydrogenase
MSGGAIGPGVIVDLSRMNEIGEIDVETRSIWVQPGALRGEVDRRAREHQLRFPVDPSSGAFCTIGGMVSTNAAGSHSLHFGAMRKWVSALDCVFEDGSRATIERGARLPEEIAALERFSHLAPRLRAASDISHDGVAKDSSGYGIAAYSRSGDLVDLLVGSEGTLAIVVGVRLKLAPLAGATVGILGAFGSLDDAVAAAMEARRSGAVACELLEKTFLDVAAGTSSMKDVPHGSEAVLLAEVEGDDAEKASMRARSLADAFVAAKATNVRIAAGASEQHEIWELRHAASPILSKLDPSLKSMQFIEDGAVPPGNVSEYVRGIRESFDKRGIRGVIFGHAGDSHIHVNPLVDVSKPGWREEVEGLLDDAVDLTASLDGTLDGEHGDGRLRTPLLSKVWSSEAIGLFGEIKKAFDPKGILNPGVKVPLEGQLPLGDIKYDPALAPLPDEARRALDRVADKRDYAEFRLSLIPGGK